MEEYSKEEKMLVNIANIVLAFGIIVSIGLLVFKSTYFYDLPYGDSKRDTYNWSEIINAITIFIISFVTWAVLKVLAKISLNINKIANK